MDGNVDPAGIVRDLAGCTASASAVCSSSTAAWACPWSFPSRSGPDRAAWTEAIDTAVAHVRRARTRARRRDLVGLERRRRPVGAARGRDEEGRLVRDHRRRRRRRSRSTLAPLPAVAGLYQDCPRWGGSDAPRDRSRPTGSCSPYPTTPHSTRSPPRASRHPLPWTTGRCLARRRRSARRSSLPRDPDAWSTGVGRAVASTSRSRCGRSSSACPARAASAQRLRRSRAPAGERRRGRVSRRRRARRRRRCRRGRRAFAPVTARRFRLVLSGGERRRRAAAARRRRAAAARPAPRDAFRHLGVRAAQRRRACTTRRSRRASVSCRTTSRSTPTRARMPGRSIPASVIDLTSLTSRRRAAVERARRPLAHPAPRRVADRADERSGARRFDRTRGRQARRRPRGGVPRRRTSTRFGDREDAGSRRRASPPC